MNIVEFATSLTLLVVGGILFMVQIFLHFAFAERERERLSSYSGGPFEHEFPPGVTVILGIILLVNNHTGSWVFPAQISFAVISVLLVAYHIHRLRHLTEILAHEDELERQRHAHYANKPPSKHAM